MFFFYKKIQKKNTQANNKSPLSAQCQKSDGKAKINISDLSYAKDFFINNKNLYSKNEFRSNM